MSRLIIGTNDLATVHPELIDEWDSLKNGNLNPQNVSFGSNKKVWWKCHRGHEWQATVNNRSNGASCPYCSGRMAVKGENSLADIRPDLLSEWDYEKNSTICNPEKVSIGSHSKVWWKCSNGHNWQAEIKLRVRGNGCPYCSGKRILSGYNDFVTLCPELVSEWNYERNIIDPKTLGFGSNKRVWWKCSKCGHEWQAIVYNRTKGSGCPECARKNNALSRSTAKADNSLSKLHPELLEEWDYGRNGNLSPDTTNVGSSRKVWWKCKECGQRYISPIISRCNGGGCPVCAGKVIVSGINDLRTWCVANDREDLLSEWDYDKNEITPTEIAPFSQKKVFFVCSVGHSYRSTLRNRTSNNTGCPICRRAKRTSFPEQAVYYYVKKTYGNAINSFHTAWLGNLELDIFIPELKTAIEYDGVSWHTDKEKDVEKTRLCVENDIRLIRIRECGLDPIEACTNITLGAITSSALNEAITETLEEIGCVNADVDVERDTPLIVKQFDNSRKDNSIARFPELLAEWDYEKNANVDPEFVSYGSMRKFWWTCSHCHTSWQMSPNARTNQGQGCPQCAGSRKANAQMKTLIKNRGSLAETNPLLLKEWDYERNTITPTSVTHASKKKVWWKCKACGGSWMASIQNRVISNNGCPYCAGSKVLTGYNDFATLHPELVNEWDCDKNEGLKPENFTVGSDMKITWTCSNCGKEWLASIRNRSKGTSCPYCARKRVAFQNQKKVKCVETNMVFNSVAEASKWANVSTSSLVGHLKGNSKTSGGFHWQYYTAEV